MNRRGTPTVGFKPYAVSMLRDLIDFMLEKIPSSKCSFFGSDGWELSTASPLTRDELVDTVVPLQLLCHPSWGSNILARTGSVATGDVEYFRSKYAASIETRPDMVELARKTGLPICDAEIVDPLTILATPPFTPQKQQRSFDHLVSLGATGVVCEGGNRFLPVWSGCPYPDHLVALIDGTVRFYPNFGSGFDANAVATLTSGDEFIQLLDSIGTKYTSLPLYMVERGRRREIADQIVENLIGAAGDEFL